MFLSENFHNTTRLSKQHCCTIKTKLKLNLATYQQSILHFKGPQGHFNPDQKQDWHIQEYFTNSQSNDCSKESNWEKSLSLYLPLEKMNCQSCLFTFFPFPAQFWTIQTTNNAKMNKTRCPKKRYIKFRAIKMAKNSQDYVKTAPKASYPSQQSWGVVTSITNIKKKVA